MSNHSGSYLINEILYLMQKYNVFDSIGKEKTLSFLNEVKWIGYKHDCNNGEILEGISDQLKVCYICWEYGNEMNDGICETCVAKLWPPEEKNAD